jgi:hypothetical protein
MRLAARLLCALMFTGCAATATHLRSGPPTGEMWGFVVNRENGYGEEIAIYAPEPLTCGASRVAAVRSTGKYAHRVPPQCQLLTVSSLDSGTEQQAFGTQVYWMFLIDDGADLVALGANWERVCNALRAETAKDRDARGVALGRCRPVVIKRLTAE